MGPSSPTASRVCTVASSSHASVSSSTVACTSASTTPSSPSCWETTLQSSCPSSWAGSSLSLRPDVLPHRHHPSAYDDDLRTGRQVQGLHGLRRPGPQERRLHVPHEGSRRQHPPWCGRRWCPGWIRQVQGAVHPVEIGLNHLLSPVIFNF